MEIDLERIYDVVYERATFTVFGVGETLQIARIRILTSERGLQQIETREDRLMLRAASGYVKDGSRFPRIRGEDADAKLEDIIQLVSQQPVVPS